jgi:photosystem II stability/assembly factor-like uncharacterized protein
MKLLFSSLRTISIILCLVHSVSAQWVRQYPMKKLEHVLDIVVTPDGYGFAVGNNDLVLRKVGNQWQLREGPNKNWDLKAVDHLENTLGTFVAVGGQGLLLSQDAGLNWEEIPNAPSGIHAIKILSPTRVLVSSGNGVFVWENQDWTDLNLPVTSGVGDACILDEDHIWCFTTGTNPVIYYTSNGGDTWSMNSDIDRPDVVRFYNTQYGVALDGREVFHSENGGLTWTSISNNIIHNSSYDLTFGSSPNVLMAATFNGEPTITQDSGKTWTKFQLGTINERNYSIASASDEIFWVGNDISSIMLTTDAGETWTETSGPQRALIYDVNFTTRAEGIAVGNFGTVLRTLDGGTQWQEVPFDSTRTGWSVHGLNSNDLWLGANRGGIFHSSDKGLTWTERVNFGSGSINDILAISATRILAVSTAGIIYLTNDAGATWDTVYQTNNQIRSIARIDNQRYMATGFNGLLLKSNNQGDTWTPVTPPEAGLQYEQSQFIGDEGWLVTSSFKNTMWHSTNAGDTWTPLTLPIDRFWDGLYFITPDTGIVVSRSNVEGRAYITFNGGMNWQSGYITDFPFFGVSGLPNPNGTAWIFGFGSDIEVLPYCNAFPVIGDFAGDLFPCENDTVEYSISSQDVDVYNWSFPSDWQIIGDANNDTVHVEVGRNSGNVSIIGSNICGFSGQLSFSAGASWLPVISGIIADPTLCTGSVITFTAEETDVDFFAWSVPADWSILGSPNQSSANIIIGTESGFVSVEGTNQCGSTGIISMEYFPSPLPTISLISADLTPCPGDTVVISFDSQIDNTYNFNSVGLEDWTLINSAAPKTIRIIAGNNPGTLNIFASNNCGNGGPLSLEFAPELVPQAGIFNNGPQLYSLSQGIAYQWYLDGEPIPGATTDTITPLVSGEYTLLVTYENGCSDLSFGVFVVISGIFNPLVTLPLDLYPMPVNDVLYLKNIENEYRYMVLDYTGKEVMQNVANENKISVSELAKGIYLLKVEQGTRIYMGRFVKS